MNDKAKYYIDILTSAYSDEYADLRLAYFAVYGVFAELLGDVLQGEKQAFFSDYSKIEYVINQKKLDDELVHNLHTVRYYTSKIRRKRKFKITQNEINLLAKVVIELCSAYFGEYENEFVCKMRELYTRTIPYEQERLPDVALEDFMSCVVMDKFSDEANPEEKFLVVKTPENEQVTVRLSHSWEYMFPVLKCGNNLNILQIFRLDEANFAMRKESLLVLEPDVLLDVTDLASCFSDKDYDYRTFFVNQFAVGEVSAKMFVGNLVNFIFDELIINIDADFNEIYERAICSKPLSLFCLSTICPQVLRSELDALRMHYDNLRAALRGMNLEKASIEPSFISAEYGIQGRLDLLLEYIDDDFRKDIIELKSGKAPTINKTANIGAAHQPVQIGMWYNNFAQVTCYNMLLDSAFSGRIGNSAVLYSVSAENACRNAVISVYTKWQIVHLRNKIVTEMLNINSGNTEILDVLLGDNPEVEKQMAIFTKRRLDDLKQAYRDSKDVKREYFRYFFVFILREMLASQLEQAGRSDSLSMLWKKSIEEKAGSYSFMQNLELCEEKSDFARYYLYFARHDEGISTFRRGDIVLLYPFFDDFVSPINDQLIKCAIKEIDSEHIILSLRNKLFPVSVFKKDYPSWMIEADRSDSNTKKLFGNLLQFLKTDAHKSDILQGLKSPDFTNTQVEDIPELNENQNALYKDAVSAKDYYLLQGPPGTGKTSYMLKNIVKHEIDTQSYDLLLLAYTNRAADEICDVLNRLGEKYDYIRLGNKEASVHEEKLIANLAEKEDIRRLFRKFAGIRIVVSTIYSAIGNPEIYDLKNFGNVIIDEAAQVLEPQIIGIISRIPKFVMIGDEKQLPAISVQTADVLADVDNPNFAEIELSSPTMSLFERLLRNCKKNGWTRAYGILKRQARMHAEIQEFPNKYFYGGNLSVKDAESWQTRELQIPADIPQDSLLQQVLQHRMSFIDVATEKLAKANRREAAIVVSLVNELAALAGDDFNEKTIGVISPFRAQCTEIFNSLDPKIRPFVTVDTVERFQGSERKIIIYSLAVNYRVLLNNIVSEISLDGSIIDRKLNVAMTRAKEQFIVTGNSAILSESSTYRVMIDFIKSKGGYIEDHEVTEL